MSGDWLGIIFQVLKDSKDSNVATAALGCPVERSSMAFFAPSGNPRGISI
jgi:hypothetical protein